MKFLFTDNDYLSVNHVQIIFFHFFFAAVFYTSFYALKPIAIWFKFDFANNVYERKKMSIRITSSVHATSVTLLAIWNMIYNEELYKNKLTYRSEEISFNLNIVMGYMTFDILLMLVYEELRELVSIFHHIISVSAFYACSNVGVFSFIAIFRLTSEGSTPFINLRFLLLSFEKKDSIWYSINGFLILIAFGVFRVIPILPIWYTFYLGMYTPEWDQIHIFFKFLCVITSLPLDVLNIYWFNLIFSKAIEFLKGNEVDSPKQE